MGIDIEECRSALDKIMNKKTCEDFNYPVDPIKLGLPGYFDVIKHPLDLGTIKVSSIPINSI
jgi:transcription initiation factor TFIID subunit 2